MREIPYDFDAAEHYRNSDWKESPHIVLEDVERELEPHGLEIEQMKDPGDCYVWRIVVRQD